jgi:dethiobiotin synthetase
MPRVVVLGTGTGVGKTYFTVALARALRAHEATSEVLAVKPIETGLRQGSRGSDARKLELASTKRPARPHPLFGFREPISPHLAAKRQGSPISVSKLLKWLEKSEASPVAIRDATIHWTLIETAGGALSPLGPRRTNLDLARSLDPAIWILVAPDALGVLHDVTATVVALRALARAPDFVVLSASRRPDASTRTNAVELRALGVARPIASLARGCDAASSLRTLVSALHSRALTNQ